LTIPSLSKTAVAAVFLWTECGKARGETVAKFVFKRSWDDLTDKRLYFPSVYK